MAHEEREDFGNCHGCIYGFVSDALYGFAAASGIRLEGELKLRGSAAVGSELSADFEKYSRKG